MLKLTADKRKYIFPFLITASVIACYQFAFKRTLEASRINKYLAANVAHAADISYQPQYLERKNSNLDHIIALYKGDTVTFRDKVINDIALLAGSKNVKVTGVPVHLADLQPDGFFSQNLELQGSFFSLLEVINKLHALEGVGAIRQFSIKSTHRSGSQPSKSQLQLEITMIMIK